ADDAYYEAAYPDVDSGYESAQQDDSLLPLLLLAPEEGPDSVDVEIAGLETELAGVADSELTRAVLDDTPTGPSPRALAALRPAPAVQSAEPSAAEDTALELLNTVDTSAADRLAAAISAFLNAFKLDISPASPNRVVFVDPGLEDYRSFVNDARLDEAGTKVVTLDAGKDGVQQIADTLKDMRGVSAVHILSHGESGGLQLGNAQLDGTTLNSHAGQLATWGNALAADGDILLYGCRIGSGSAGTQFITSLADLTKADIAASTDDTGSAPLGGDWDLEFRWGQVQAQVLAFTDYDHLLGIVGLTEIETLDALTQGPSDTLVIEIGGTEPGNPAGGNDIDGFDQINVTNAATLDGALDVRLVNDYVPVVGTTFDFLTFGSVSGTFDNALGLYGWGDGSLYFDVVQQGDRLQLVTRQVPGGGDLIPDLDTQQQDNSFGEFLSGYFNITSVEVTGDLNVAGMAAVSGSFVFGKDGNDLTIAATNAAAFLGTGYGTADPMGLEITDASGALFITDAGVATDVRGDAALVGFDAITLTGSDMRVEINTTGAAVNESITVGAETVAISYLDGTEVKSFSGALSGSVEGFVSLDGDFGFGMSGTKVVAVGSDVTAELKITDSVYVRFADADFGFQSGSAAFELKDGTFSATIGGLADITADSVLVRYTDATGTVSAGTTLTVGSTSYTFGQDIAANTTAFQVTGFEASVADFVTLSGDLGFKKTGANIIAVGSDVTASLDAGPVNVQLADADFGLQASDGKTAFELKDGVFSATIAGLASITADSVLVQYTGATTTVTAGTALTVGATTYTFA
ncbi:MAG: DUF4347 domain-containing protein, partial [Planctomycetes bacterium]|nr:DUF4347 domain-containing protein [Planctomycetota bacterium]